MSSWVNKASKAVLAAAMGGMLAFSSTALAQKAQPQKAAAKEAVSFPGIGRPATDLEVAKWNIDVRPDFEGLPPGSGSAEKGMDVWETKCAHCHGIFGESNEFFTPLIGGTTKEDIEKGRVANLQRTDYPGRTAIMKVPTVSTLWDYINRAMPWTEPKSLTTEEVYSVLAYLLSMADIVPDDFVLSDKNIAEVQERMPNRNGMSTAHAMWPGKEFGGTKADVANTLCMKDCSPTGMAVSSTLPDHALNAHGNLEEQNRLVGPQRGLNTAPEGEKKPEASKEEAKPAAGALADDAAITGMLSKYACTACHSVDKKLVGPAYKDVAQKYQGQAEYLAGKIKSGGTGVWGPIPMPAQTLPDADAQQIANWLAGVQ